MQELNVDMNLSNWPWQDYFFQARSALRDLDPTNEVTFLRLRSKKNEILLAPGERIIIHVLSMRLNDNERWKFYFERCCLLPDKEFTLIVVQNPTDGPDHQKANSWNSFIIVAGCKKVFIVPNVLYILGEIQIVKYL